MVCVNPKIIVSYLATIFWCVLNEGRKTIHWHIGHLQNWQLEHVRHFAKMKCLFVYCILSDWTFLIPFITSLAHRDRQTDTKPKMQVYLCHLCHQLMAPRDSSLNVEQLICGKKSEEIKVASKIWVFLCLKPDSCR